jgi:hypothetical protein
MNVYNPLPNINVDIKRLYAEIFHFWKLDFNTTSSSCVSFTTAKKYIDDSVYNFDRYHGISKFAPGSKRLKKIYPDGEFDHNLVHWPKISENTYMKELGDYFAQMLNVTHYRCRVSYYNSLDKDFVGELHNDPHTPYRIHIALKSDPAVKWILVDKYNNTYDIYQPADGTPVLIETYPTQHQIIVPKNSVRIHLWFQYYNDIDQALLDNLYALLLKAKP